MFNVDRTIDEVKIWTILALLRCCSGVLIRPLVLVFDTIYVEEIRDTLRSS
jgi:hypothetical protein